MIPVIFQIGPLPVNSFGLMLVFCFLAAGRLFKLELEKRGAKGAFAEDALFWGAVSGIAGARLLYMLNSGEPFSIADIFSTGGFTFYGGFILATCVVVAMAYRARLSVALVADAVAPALALGYAIGRVGCHLSGDGDYGVVTTVPWGFRYLLGVIPTDPAVYVHPTPAYETIMALLTVWILQNFASRSKPIRSDGAVFGLYLVLSSCSLFVEFLRIEPKVLAWASEAQVIALPLVLIGLFLIFRECVFRARFSGS